MCFDTRYQLLAPAFADMWKKWLADETAAARKVKAVEKAENEEAILKIAKEMLKRMKITSPYPQGGDLQSSSNVHSNNQWRCGCLFH